MLILLLYYRKISIEIYNDLNLFNTMQNLIIFKKLMKNLL